MARFKMIHQFDDKLGKWVVVDEGPKRSRLRGGAAAAGVVMVALAASALFILQPASVLAPLKAVTANEPEDHAQESLGIDWEKRAPRYGRITLGAYAGEAAEVAGVRMSSTQALADQATYRQYRHSVHTVYGLDLEDMNYFQAGGPGWEERVPALESWMRNAGQFGDVTLALEPSASEGYAVFSDSPGMRALRAAFEGLDEQGVTVYIRFASEANLRNNPYSVYPSRDRALEFYRSACWFKEYMPSNVKLVFSPLINTTVRWWGNGQSRIIRLMFVGDDTTNHLSSPWSRIGGTLYRTDMPLKSTYTRYVSLMSQLDQNSLSFQICELGGPYSRRKEIISFLDHAAEGGWPQLIKINLFARDINRRADPEGHFGFIEPGLREAARQGQIGGDEPVESWLKHRLTKNP